MGSATLRLTTVFSVTLFLLTSLSCQRVEQSQIELTQSQWQDIQQHMPDERPSPEYELGVEYGDEIELIGLDIDGEFIQGESVELTWYWQALEDVDQDWQIFVHFDSEEEPFRQNLDHYPLGQITDNTFRTYHWEEGHIIADRQRFVLSEDYPVGDAVFYVGLFRGEQRSPVSNDATATEDNRGIGPTVEIKAGDGEESAADTSTDTEVTHQHTLPRLAEEHLEEFELNGRLDDAFWGDVPSLRLEPLAPGYAQDSIVQAAYTEEHLLISARLIDANLELLDEDEVTTGPEMWKGDALAVYLAPTGADGAYVEILVSPFGELHGIAFDAPPSSEAPPSSGDDTRQQDSERGRSWNPDGLEAATHRSPADADNTFWSAELRIPFAELPDAAGAPDERDMWHVNVVRFDRPGQEQHFAYGWPDTARHDHHRVDQFGQWTFGSLVQDAPTVQQFRADDQRLPEQIRKQIEQRRSGSPEGTE